MCGFAGIYDPHRSQDGHVIMERMLRRLTHRGPDDSGVWQSPQDGITLGHTRLSILDLSQAGHQPMVSSCGTYVIAFNGEIYNHSELRNQLAGIDWRGQSDTETLLVAIQKWGITEAIERSTGMFAFALWNRQRKLLHLVRDRIGEKPLYYGWNNGVFLFGSELKSLLAHPKWGCGVDRRALSLYVRYGYVPVPYSIWNGIRKLPPGNILTLNTSESVDQVLEPKKYWSISSSDGLGSATVCDESFATHELERLLKTSISRQITADVPVGAFLSGGVDSSTVVALMRELSSSQVKTFTIGFDESDYDEAPHAKLVAEQLGTDHHELYLSSEDTRSVIPKIPYIYDEPFGDVSQIPTYLVASLARQSVTVCLTGDGADELFGGYNRYFLGARIWSIMRRFPIHFRRLISRGLIRLSPETWDSITMKLPKTMRYPMFGDRVHKLAGVLGASTSSDLYQYFISHERDADSVVINDSPIDSHTLNWADVGMRLITSPSFSQRMMLSDQIGYLTDDILCKVDRASMAVSLETRIPFLDHSIIEFANRLPSSLKIRNGSGKWLLKQVLYKRIDRDIIERPKQGFGVPIDSWLRGPLRDWAESLLDKKKIDSEGYFRAEIVRQKWHEHLSGRRNWQYWLWNILMYQSWREKWGA